MRGDKLFLTLIVALAFITNARAFIAVPKGELILDPTLTNLTTTLTNVTTFESKPRATFYVLNNGTGVVRVINSTLITDQNHILLSSPTKVEPGFTRMFRYEFTTILCSADSSASFHFETWYYPTANLTGEPRMLNSTIYTFNISEFLFIENVVPGHTNLGVDVSKGEQVTFTVRNRGNQPVNYKMNLTHSPSFIAKLTSAFLDFEETSVEEQNFTLGPLSSQVWSIDLIPVQMAKSQKLEVRVYSPDCYVVNDSFAKNVTIFWVREGIITQEIIPDLSLFSLLTLFALSSLLISKFYYL